MGDNGRMHPRAHRNKCHPHRKNRHRVTHIQPCGSARKRQNAVHHARLLRDQGLHHIVGVVAVEGCERHRPVKLEAEQDKEKQPLDACAHKQGFRHSFYACPYSISISDRRVILIIRTVLPPQTARSAVTHDKSRISRLHVPIQEHSPRRRTGKRKHSEHTGSHLKVIVLHPENRRHRRNLKERPHAEIPG